MRVFCMNRVAVAGAVLASTLAAFLSAGCRVDQRGVIGRRYHLGPGRDAIVNCLESTGGVSRWQGAGAIRATAVVTLYDGDGQAYVNRQRHVLDLKAGRIVARAETSGGTWQATVKADGKSSWSSRGGARYPTNKEHMSRALATVLHRVRGPINFLGHGERPRSARRTRVDGADVIRVGVSGDNRQAVAYYFDATTGLLRFVTAGADRPGREGTITIYQHMLLPNGMVFPRSLRVVKIGRYVLIGPKPVLDVEFSDVRF